MKATEAGFARSYGAVYFKTKHNRHFRFLDLPKDIRLMVYDKVLLEKPDAFRYHGPNESLDKYPNVADWGDKEWDEWNSCMWEAEDEPFHPGYDIKYHWTPETRKMDIQLTKPFASGHTSILSTCRQIRDEASDIFYGSPRFILASTEMLCQFALSIGQNKESVRRVTVVNPITYISAGRASSQLQGAKNLRSLSLLCTWEQVANPRSPRRCFQIMQPVYSMLFDREPDFESAVAVISWMLPDMPCPARVGNKLRRGPSREHWEILFDIWLEEHLEHVRDWYDSKSGRALKRKEMEAARAEQALRKRVKQAQGPEGDFVVGPRRRFSLPAVTSTKPERENPARRARRTTNYNELVLESRVGENDEGIPDSSDDDIDGDDNDNDDDDDQDDDDVKMEDNW